MTFRTPFGLHTTLMLARIAVLATVVVVVDLIVGRVVTAALGPDAERHAWWLIGDDVGLEYVRNTGAAFGIFEGNPELLAALSILISFGFVWLILGEMTNALWATLAAGLLLGGAAGNLIGRIVDGFVTDYLAVGPWPRFNVADSAITVGVAIFLIALVFDDGPDATNRSGRPVEDDNEMLHGRDVT